MKLLQSFGLRAAVFVALIFSVAESDSLSLRRGEFDRRYLWVVRNTLAEASSIDRMLNFATENRFNHILVQVRGRGDAYYQSDIVPKSHLIKNQDFDPLAYLIPKAQEKGIQVHAWVNAYLLWSSRIKPVQQNHLLYSNESWLDQNNPQPFNIDTELKKLNGGKNGNEGLYLAPHHPEVNLYLLSVFKELVTRYTLDGLHLDYIRYHDSDFGYNPVATTLYRKEKGINIDPSGSESETGNNATSSVGQWSDYRRNSVTELVRETKNMLLEIQPECELSAAVKPNLYQARERYYQEWDVWLAAGYLDKAIVMNYTPNLRDFAANIDIIYDNLPSKYRKNIAIGIATYNQSSREVVDKIKYTRVTRFKEISLFSYNVMEKNPRYFMPLKKILYP